MNTIEKITGDKRAFLDILMIADPSEKAIDCYLEQSDLFVMSRENTPICVAAVLQISKSTCELKNIAVTKPRCGYGSKMIDYICSYYKNKYKSILVGTADTSTGNMRFYESKGFERTHRIDNFYTDNYDSPIYEDGVQCKHMVMFQRSL